METNESQKLIESLSLGQSSDHGVAMMNNTIAGGFPCEIAWKVGEALRKRCMPQDVTAKIEMEKALDNNLKFSNANNF